MQSFNLRGLATWLMTMLFCLGVACCRREVLRPIQHIKSSLLQSGKSRSEPALGQGWLANLANKQGKESIELINLRSLKPVPLPGINRADSKPISVSVNANGERIALVRQREDQTELLLYQRRLGTLQRLELGSKGIPYHVSLDGSGRFLAVQVSRDGQWEVELLRLPR